MHLIYFIPFYFPDFPENIQDIVQNGRMRIGIERNGRRLRDWRSRKYTFQVFFYDQMRLTEASDCDPEWGRECK